MIHLKGHGRGRSYYGVICVEELKETRTVREQLAQNTVSLNSHTRRQKIVSSTEMGIQSVQNVTATNGIQ